MRGKRRRKKRKTLSIHKRNYSHHHHHRPCHHCLHDDRTDKAWDQHSRSVPAKMSEQEDVDVDRMTQGERLRKADRAGRRRRREPEWRRLVAVREENVLVR